MAEVNTVDHARYSELINSAIPNGRKALLDSHKNLGDLAVYCEQTYAAAQTPEAKNQALALSKQYAIQSLASVAYMVNSMATNVLEMFNHQYLQLNGLESTIHNIKQNTDIHKEKVARREIGLMTSTKRNKRVLRMTAPDELDFGRPYHRTNCEMSALDNVGHGVPKSEPRRQRRNTSVAGGSPMRSSGMHQAFGVGENPMFVASPMAPMGMSPAAVAAPMAPSLSLSSSPITTSPTRPLDGPVDLVVPPPMAPLAPSPPSSPLYDAIAPPMPPTSMPPGPTPPSMPTAPAPSPSRPPMDIPPAPAPPSIPAAPAPPMPPMGMPPAPAPPSTMPPAPAPPLSMPPPPEPPTSMPPAPAPPMSMPPAPAPPMDLPPAPAPPMSMPPAPAPPMSMPPAPAPPMSMPPAPAPPMSMPPAPAPPTELPPAPSLPPPMSFGAPPPPMSFGAPPPPMSFGAPPPLSPSDVPVPPQHSSMSFPPPMMPSGSHSFPPPMAPPPSAAPPPPLDPMSAPSSPPPMPLGDLPEMPLLPPPPLPAVEQEVEYADVTVPNDVYSMTYAESPDDSGIYATL